MQDGYTRMRTLRICFVAHNAYGAMAGGRSGHIGGVERQVSLMARWLADRGHDVSLLTWDEGQPDGEVIDGVRVHTICRQNEGIRGIRFLHPRWSGLVRAMRRANADVYYFNSAECTTGQMALFCRHARKRFVYSVASEPACDRRLPLLNTLRERWLYRYGLTHADTIIVQTARQQQLLSDGFGLDSLVLPMPCPQMRATASAPPSILPQDRPVALWVARVARMKRLELLLDAAERLPEVHFAVVGPSHDPSYSRPVLERARQIPNVTVHGGVARDDMPAFYSAASVLCCTSEYEGFPNTFLEAWSHGVPVVSTFDPDEVIARRQLGVVVQDAAGLVSALRSLIGSPSIEREVSANARRHFERNHAVEVAMPRFERALADWRARPILDEPPERPRMKTNRGAETPCCTELDRPTR